MSINKRYCNHLRDTRVFSIHGIVLLRFLYAVIVHFKEFRPDRSYVCTNRFIILYVPFQTNKTWYEHFTSDKKVMLMKKYSNQNNNTVLTRINYKIKMNRERMKTTGHPTKTCTQS